MAQKISLESVYREAGRSLRGDLFSIDLVRFNDIETTKIRRNASLTVAALNLAAAQWVGTTLVESGKVAERRSRTALEILGKRPKRPQITDPGYNSRQKALETLLKANVSIRTTVDQYLSISLVAAHQLRSSQIQEFSYLDAEAALDAIALEALRKQQSRGWLAKKLIEFLRVLLEADEFIEINGRTYKMSKYAKMVARTELKHARDAATNDLCHQYENDLVEISDHGASIKGSPQYCEECAKFEGKVYSLSGRHPKYPSLTSSGYLEAHPNCVLPGTRCIAPGGIVTGIRAKFSGPIVEIVFSNGSRLSVTPNHMLLTPYGFAPAYLLCEGDDVFYCPDFERIIANDPNYNGQPVLIENIIESLAESSCVATRCMPVSPEDIHGDGWFCNGDIDIIRANSFLQNTSKPFLPQHLGTNSFNSSGMALFDFFSLRSLAQVLHRAAHTADSIMGGLRLPSDFFFTEARYFNFLDFTYRSGFNAPSYEGTSNRIPVNTKFSSNINIQGSRFIKPNGLVNVEASLFSPGKPLRFGYASSGNPSLNKALANRLGIYPELFGNFIHGHSGLIALNKIIDIRIKEFSGHVYDLQTSTSLYVCNGILSSNCQHHELPTSEEAIGIRQQYETKSVLDKFTEYEISQGII